MAGSEKLLATDTRRQTQKEYYTAENEQRGSKLQPRSTRRARSDKSLIHLTGFAG